ncbi:MAG: hypothetical protein AUI64_00835 [Acidobacteria bacterium 13_1_40CM_2_64_6]|nr:MAG: hypothetical protein AUI64_00835 [Acidobacteria bacterium 13_1_40CM_2_64_6]OLE80402.1 MAG: hypothetical protein AUF76_14775 [Acidobacteria bacterium 13_1_20CM_2_65_9]
MAGEDADCASAGDADNTNAAAHAVAKERKARQERKEFFFAGFAIFAFIVPRESAITCARP